MLGVDIDLKELVARAKAMESKAPQEGLPAVPRERTGIYG